MTDSNKDSVVKSSASDVVIKTKYIPGDYRPNSLIVKRNEDVEMYGLVDNEGNVILEPEYDSLSFTYMNEENYIRAKQATDFRVLFLDGTQYIKMGKYEDIVSAGNIGWPALKKGK